MIRVTKGVCDLARGDVPAKIKFTKRTQRFTKELTGRNVLTLRLPEIVAFQEVFNACTNLIADGAHGAQLLPLGIFQWPIFSH